MLQQTTGAGGSAGSVLGRGPRRAEVRRHVGRRPRAHPRGRRPRRPHPAPRRRRRRRGQRHGQGDRRAAPPGRAGVAAPGPARDGHAHHRRRAQGDGAAVHGAARPRRRRPTRSPAARPGSSPTPPTPTPRSSRSGPTGCARRVDAGRVPVVGGAQGVSTDRDVTFLGRGGSDTTAVALAARPRGRRLRALHRRVRRVHRRPPHGAHAPAAWRRISFDEMLEMCACGCPKPAMRAVEFARTYGVALHVRSSFTWEPGTWVTEEDPDHGAGHRLRRSSTTTPRPRSRSPACPTSPASPPGCSGPGRRRTSTST